MSILLKKPAVESVVEALGDEAKASLLSIIDASGSYASYDLEKGPLPKAGSPYVERAMLAYGGKQYAGAYLRAGGSSYMLEFAGTDKCALYAVDEAKRAMRKVNEPLGADELRRVLSGAGGGGGSGLPEDYAQQLQEHIGFSDGNVQIGKGVEIDGNVSAGFTCKATLPVVQDGVVLTTVDCWVNEGFTVDANGKPIPVYFALSWAGFGGRQELFFGIVYKEDGVKAESVDEIIGGKGYIDANTLLPLAFDEDVEIGLNNCSKAKYAHCLTIACQGSEMCFTAMSSNNLVIDSYQDLETVFGGDRIALSGAVNGITQKADSKPVYIDLHGGTVAKDFIRVYDGSAFSNVTLASLPGSVTFTDDVYIPN